MAHFHHTIIRIMLTPTLRPTLRPKCFLANNNKVSIICKTLRKHFSGYGFVLNEEQVGLQDLASKFSREEIIPKAAHYDRTGEFPWDIVKKAHAVGLRNMGVPTEYGGGGLKLFDGCLVGN